MKQVRYQQNMRDRAKTERRWLVTIAVDGKHLGDDSCCVQALVDLETAKRISAISVDLLTSKKGAVQP